jgi:hypothetical protein
MFRLKNRQICGTNGRALSLGIIANYKVTDPIKRPRLVVVYELNKHHR